MPISKELQKIYASAPSDVKYIETLEFSHPNFPKTYYLTNDLHAWDYFLEDGKYVTFDPIPFEIQLPSLDNGGNQELQFSICNIGREMVQAIEAANTSPETNIQLIYRVYLDVPDSKPQNSPPLSLTISDIAVTTQTVNATATRFDVLNRAFPGNIYTVDSFPGLLR